MDTVFKQPDYLKETILPSRGFCIASWAIPIFLNVVASLIQEPQYLAKLLAVLSLVSVLPALFYTLGWMETKEARGVRANLVTIETMLDGDGLTRANIQIDIACINLLIKSNQLRLGPQTRSRVEALLAQYIGT